MGDDLNRRHHRDHVACRGDGAGLAYVIAFDTRRRTRCRLVQGARRAGATERKSLRQSRLRRHHVYRRQFCREWIFQGAAHVRRAGAAGAARERRAPLAGAAGGTRDHTGRGAASKIGTAPHLRRDRSVCGNSRHGARYRSVPIEEDQRFPSHRQGRAAR